MHHPRHPLLPLAPHYDIREIDEALYVAVLACCRADFAAAAVDLTDTATDARVTARDTEGQ
jgi:hypothetical protein